MRRPAYILFAVAPRMIAATAAFLCGVSARGEVNLAWRPATPTVRVGDTVKFGLYAVSDDPAWEETTTRWSAAT